MWKLQYEVADSLIIGLRDSATRRHFCVLALLRFDIVKNSICIFPSFWFYKCYFLSLNHVALSSNIRWNRVISKRLFESFESIRTNWRSVTYYLVGQGYCHYFCCLADCCLYFFYKRYTV